MRHISGSSPHITPSAPQRRPAAAFSLVEVLIGILILALGLLGLGAIIPVVVREQRAASDTTLGLAAANDAQFSLLNRLDLQRSPSTPNPPYFYYWVHWWEPWLRDENWSPVRRNDPKAFLWEPWKNGEIDWNSAATTGDITLSRDPIGTELPANNYLYLPQVNITIPLAERLWPPLSRQGQSITDPGLDPYRPQFVWDFVGRRVPPPPDQLDALQTLMSSPTSADDRQRILEDKTRIQVALFVRRIDLNIRVPSNQTAGSPPTVHSATLYDVLTDRSTLLQQYWRTPVAWYPTAQPPQYPPFASVAGRTYLPTNTGTSPNGMEYALPLFLSVTFDPAYPDRLRFLTLNVNDNRIKLATQIGQKLVDNLGNVYTVLGVPEDNAMNQVLIQPPVPASVPSPNASAFLRPYQLQQVVFVPQIPAAVKVFTIDQPARHERPAQ